jgi:cytochrome P450
MARNPLAFLTRAAAEHGGVVDLGPFGRRRAFLIAQPEAVQHVLLDNHRNYTKGAQFEAMRLVTGDGLVTSEGDHWRRQRRLVQPAFHRQRILEATEAMTDVTVAACDAWAAPPAGRWLDAFREMTALTQRILFRALFGVEAGDRAEAMARAWDDAFAFLTARLLSPVQLPLALPTPGNVRYRRAMALLDEVIYGIIRARRDDPAPGGLVSLLLGARDADTGEPMSERELRDEVMTFFAGGFESSAAVLAWALHLLVGHPDILRRVRAEVDAVLEGRAPTADDLGRLRLTLMVVEETLRLYPAAWIFARSNLADDEFCGFLVPARSLLFVSPYVTHRLAPLWPDPERFDPERFDPAVASTRGRFTYLPFGGGPRKCIGDVFALTEMQIVLALIVQRFDLVAAPGVAVVPSAMATLRPRQGPMFRFVPRGTPFERRATGRPLPLP